MAQQLLAVGTTAGDNTGDKIRAGAVKINSNFTELYSIKATLGGNANFGAVGTGGTLRVETPSLNSSFPSGLTVAGSYSSLKSTINFNGYGVNSGGGYTSEFAFSCTSNGVLNEIARIKPDGISVGSTTPSTSTTSGALTVAGGIGFAGDMWMASDKQLHFGPNYALQASSTYNVLYAFSNAGQTTGMYLAGGAWVNVSDRRIKEDIETLSVLEMLANSNFRAVRYLNTMSGEIEIGGIAQEQFKLFPEFVHVGSDDDDAKFNKLIDPGIWALRYDRYGIVALQGVSELSAELTKLKSQIIELQMRRTA